MWLRILCRKNRNRETISLKRKHIETVDSVVKIRKYEEEKFDITGEENRVINVTLMLWKIKSVWENYDTITEK